MWNPMLVRTTMYSKSAKREYTEEEKEVERGLEAGDEKQVSRGLTTWFTVGIVPKEEVPSEGEGDNVDEAEVSFESDGFVFQLCQGIPAPEIDVHDVGHQHVQLRCGNKGDEAEFVDFIAVHGCKEG